MQLIIIRCFRYPSHTASVLAYARILPAAHITSFMQLPATIYLLEAKLFYRSWVGRFQLGLIETGPDRGVAVNIDTYQGGPRRKLGIELSTQRLECVDTTSSIPAIVTIRQTETPAPVIIDGEI